jgi:hypothetical protein
VALTFFEAVIIKWNDARQTRPPDGFRDIRYTTIQRFQIIYNMVKVYCKEDKEASVGIEWNDVEEYPKLKEAMQQTLSRVNNEGEGDDPDNSYEKVCIQQHPITDPQATLDLIRKELYSLDSWFHEEGDRSQMIAPST